MPAQHTHTDDSGDVLGQPSGGRKGGQEGSQVREVEGQGKLQLLEILKPGKTSDR